jgi:sortase A
MQRAVSNPMRRNKALKWLEYLFLLTGLLTIDYFIWVNVDARISQAFDEWKFERTLSGQNASFGTYVTDESGLRRFIGLGQPQAVTPEARRATIPHRSGVEQAHRRTVQPDELLGRIEIPRLDVRATIREGAEEDTLAHAVGHIPSTALPGEMGNAGFAGHRDTFFRALRNVRRNDRIVVSTLDGTYEYLVTSTKIVSPNDVSVLKASAGRELTLVTCYPFYYIGSAPRRFIVHATQVTATPQQPPAAIKS